METFRAGETGHDDSFFLPAVDFSGVIGIERVLAACCGGNRCNVFNELALLCDSVLRVITGPNFMFALLPCDLLSLTLKFDICLSILATRPPLSNVSMSSN